MIWARFTHDIDRIAARLRKDHNKSSAVTYNGLTTTKERDEAKKRFLGGDARFFVSNPAAGGTGLNLQGKCRSVIYYSNDYSARSRWQSEDRTHRMGMEGTVTYTDLAANKSVDLAVLRNLQAKKSVSDLTLDAIRRAILG